MSAAEWLDRVDALAREATEGPWTVVGAEGWVWADAAETEVARALTEADAQFLAAARILLPQAVAALRAVLDLHHDVNRRCWECGVSYPCPTRAAITKALT